MPRYVETYLHATEDRKLDAQRFKLGWEYAQQHFPKDSETN